MSEWDYLPTPYESLVESESKHSILTFMSLVCLFENELLSPSDILVLSSERNEYKTGLKYILDRTSMEEMLRTMLQYEDLRS
jgi:hypothetical protein